MTACRFVPLSPSSLFQTLFDYLLDSLREHSVSVFNLMGFYVTFRGAEICRDPETLDLAIRPV